ncbi:unnamed protein product, partial [Mesorhabditis belari]|uniref:Cadherin domain-containing protein n=1 Tax=Mesorhabditis belari TaxID=2138241 RepID=A0AAF3EV45_9BILA
MWEWSRRMICRPFSSHFLLFVQLLLFSPFVSPSCLLENGRSSVYLSVFEDLRPGEVVGKIPLENFKPNGGIELKVVKGFDFVDIEPGSNLMKLTNPLDRDEGNSKIEAVVECKSTVDPVSDFNQLNITVFITVKDVNDNSPQFEQSEYHVNISEELPIGTIVFTGISATDKDQPGPNSFLQYSILPSEFSNLLDIEDPFKPVITVKNRIDYEKVKKFTVQIEARDQGEPNRASVVPLHVMVEDQNDLNPHFERDYYLAKRIKDGLLVVEPFPIKAVDGDALNANIVYSLNGELSSHFAIDQNGQIRVRSNPPPPFAVFFVHAHEEKNRDRNATAILKVQLGANIHFENDLYNLKLSSNTPQGTILTRIKAYTESNNQIKYRLQSPEVTMLRVDPHSGNVIMGKIPIQLKVFYEFNITATDGNEEALARIHVFLDAVTDCSEGPRFERVESTADSPEGLALIGPLKTNTEHVSYELLNMKKDFHISGDGVVSMRQGASPQCVVCELVVLAKDQQGRIGHTKVILRNPGLVMSASSALTFLVLTIFALIMIMMIVFVCKKVSYVWRQNKRQRMCWLNRSTDSGVIITGTMPSSTTRYVVNPEKGIDNRISDIGGQITQTKSPAPVRTSGAHLVPVTVSNRDGAPTVYF